MSMSSTHFLCGCPSIGSVVVVWEQLQFPLYHFLQWTFYYACSDSVVNVVLFSVVFVGVCVCVY